MVSPTVLPSVSWRVFEIVCQGISTISKRVSHKGYLKRYLKEGISHEVSHRWNLKGYLTEGISTGVSQRVI